MGTRISLRGIIKALGITAGLFISVASVPLAGHASSHREAPLITTMPKTDGTDFYMFNSYEPGRTGFVTIVADYQPLEDPFAGPNYYTMDPEALYDININNNGNALPQIIFRFHFTNTIQNLTLPVNGVNIKVPLVNTGAIGIGATANSNVVETYTVEEITKTGKESKSAFLTNAADGSTIFTKPTDNIGQKTFGSPADYESYADQFIYDVEIPNCATEGKLFVGQRKDPFVVNLGETFDLINVSNPVGPPNEATDALAAKNVTALEMEVPSACLVESTTQPIIGGWTTASLPQMRTLFADPKHGKFSSSAVDSSNEFVQVSRLGMPLVNELIIGLPDKDKFNSSQPVDDAQFLTYVTTPFVPTFIQSLFPQFNAPTLFPRADLVATFLTGLKGINQPPNVVPSEMLRLNTSTAVTPAATQSRLGALGGDLAGYPNGRRPGDDSVDITLDVAMGVLIKAGSFGFGTPSQAPSGALPFTDGAFVDATFFNDAFPYLKTPLGGSPNGPVPDNNGLPVNGAQSGGD
jgi:hypothetical protein